jgi:protein TonB
MTRMRSGSTGIACATFTTSGGKWSCHPALPTTRDVLRIEWVKLARVLIGFRQYKQLRFLPLNTPAFKLIRLFHVSHPKTALLELSPAIGKQTKMAGKKALPDLIAAKDSSRNMTSLLAILSLVTLLHISGASWFIWTTGEKPVAKPLPIEVSLLAIPAPKPTPAKPSPPRPAAKKPPRKKIQPKPKLKKSLAGAATAFAATEQVLDRRPEITEALPATANTNPPTKAEIQPYTEAYLNPAYLRNPAPEYPRIARNRGWQGTVVLRVKVNAEGKPESLAVERSCGHDMLDESAMAAVKSWQFVPAMRGETPEASTVLVPIVFALQER